MLLVLAILAVIAFFFFGRVRENTVREVCRTSADSMARNARMMAVEDGPVTSAHLATAYAESRFPSGSSWDPGALLLLYATPNGGEPLSASCNWSTGPGVAAGRAGYVQVG